VKKIIGLTLAALVVVAMIAVGTFALFFDTETSTGNTITAGTLNLTADVTGGGSVSGSKTGSGDGVNQYLTISDALIGDTGTITFTLANTGSAPGTLTIVSTGTSDENTIWEPEAAAGGVTNGSGNGEMGKVVQFSGTKQITTDASPIVIDLNATDPGGQIFDLSKLVDYLNLESVALSKASGTTYSVIYVITWNMPNPLLQTSDHYFDTSATSAYNNNMIQSDILNLGLTFTLTQSA